MTRDPIATLNARITDLKFDVLQLARSDASLDSGDARTSMRHQTADRRTGAQATFNEVNG